MSNVECIYKNYTTIKKDLGADPNIIPWEDISKYVNNESESLELRSVLENNGYKETNNDDKFIYIKEEPAIEEIEFKGEYFSTNEDAVHVSKKEVQRMINNVINELKNSDRSGDFCFHATGDTFVIGMGSKKEKEIDLIVTQDYDEASLILNNHGDWEAVDYNDHNRYQYMSKEELIAEVKKYKKIVKAVKDSEYN